MATPYLQISVDECPSTQDIARSKLDDLPVVVIAARQTEGRGRTGSGWESAPRALAVSLARDASGEEGPVSLTAGVAALRAVGGVSLKWPNDILAGGLKVGGILVERSERVVVIGLGLNLWWPNPPVGAGALYTEDPGASRHAELGALWAAELMRLLGGEGWPVDEYRAHCTTIGREITWEPDGAGRAIEVSEDGSLMVEVDGEVRMLRSGAVRHVRV